MNRSTFALGAAVLASLIAPATGEAATPDGAGPWMDAVVSSRQGAVLDGTTIARSRSVPESALGVAETDDVEGTFFSLGFGGTITLRSDAPICNGPGADLRVVESTNTQVDSREAAKVEVSSDGVTWTTARSFQIRSGDIDLPAGVGPAYYVRITDVSAPDEFERPHADGYDVNGASSLTPATCGPVVPNPPNPTDPTTPTTPTTGGGTGGTQTGSTPAPAETPTSLTASNAASLSLTGTPSAAAGRNASEQLLACTTRRLLIEDVYRSGRKLQILGVADASLIGRSIEIKISRGPVLGRATVGEDGSYRLVSKTVALSASKLDAARVVARLGVVTSPAVKVSRRLLTRSITLRSSTLRWSGRLTRPLAKSRATVTLTRRSGCNSYRTLTPVKRVRVRSNGSFTLIYKAPSTGSAVYRLQSSVPATSRNPKLFRTFSLQRGFDFGA